MKGQDERDIWKVICKDTAIPAIEEPKVKFNFEERIENDVDHPTHAATLSFKGVWKY